MTSSGSSGSYERGKARVRDEVNHKRRVGHRSSSLDENSCSCSEAERNEGGNPDDRRKRGNDYERPSHREGRRSGSCERSRKRKRNSSCSASRGRKSRCISDSDKSYARSRPSKRDCHSQCKYSSFHKHYWHRSGGSRNEKCRCVSFPYLEKENRTIYKRKGRRSRSLEEKPYGGKHHQSPARESTSHGSSCRTLQTSKARRQTSCNVNYFQDKIYLQTESESPRRDTHSSNSARFREEELKEESRSYYGTSSGEKGIPRPGHSVHRGGTDLKAKLRSNGRSTEEISDRHGAWLGPSIRRKYGEDQVSRPQTTGTDSKNSSDWLDLSLKAPAKPTPKIEGIRGEDFRLCLDLTLPSGPAIRAADGRKVVAELASRDDDNARDVSSCREGLDASLCSTSYFSVQAGLASCNDSPSGRSSPPEVAFTGNNLPQDKATFKLQKLTTSPSTHSDRYLGSSGCPLRHEDKTKEERCVYPSNGLISSGEDKAKMVAVAGTDLPVDGPSEKVAVSCKGEVPSENATTSATRTHMSVSIIELSNSLSAQENDGERLDDNKEVNSVDCVSSPREKTGVSAVPDIPAKPAEPSPQPEARKPRKPAKARNPPDTSCVVVELSDSTASEEDEDECAGETQSQPAWPPAISQLKETTDKRKSTPTPAVKDRPPLRSGLKGSHSGRGTSLGMTSEAALQRTVIGMVEDSVDADHATDMFIKKVQTLLNLVRPNTPTPDTRMTRSSTLKETQAEQPRSSTLKETQAEQPRSSTLKETQAEQPRSSTLKETQAVQPKSKDRSKREDSCSSRHGKIEVVELSDSSTEPINASDESDSDTELIVSTKNHSHMCDRKFKPLETSKETYESARVMNDHSTQYLNEDVVCCSSKPPLKRSRENSGEAREDSGEEDERNRVTYVRDRHGNLIQVIDVDDSDAEGDYEEQDNKSSDGDKEDEFRNPPQATPITEEIQPSWEGDENSHGERSGEKDDQSEPTSPPVLKVRPSARGQIITREPSKRKKPRKLVLEESDSQEGDGEKEAANRSKPAVPIVRGKQREKWKKGIICDLCSLGPSIALGEWYCWCCGMAATSCECNEEKKMRKQLSLGYRKGQKRKKRGKQILRYQWSGKVHKMCALWSSEVYVQQSQKKEQYFAQLEAAVKRGSTLVCKHPTCKKTGATLGCRVRSCRRSYHYPCAENLANQCMLRMWDGVLIPIACQYHRHVEDQAERAKERLLRSKITDPVRDGKIVVPAERPYIGKKLLCQDIAEGQEQVQIPCTNDVDDEPVPRIRYITKCWFKGRTVDHLHPFGTELAKGCQGCGGSDFDNPHSFMPLHVIGTDRSRESDHRVDWQGELMYGRLPYSSAGLLQLGPDSKDIIECNSRCKCGPKCKNRELQKGLRCHLELFKTKDRGWGVRALEQIPRGKFVVEYVGDVLTQAEADERGEKYDQNQLSYLFNLDHPEVPHSNAIVLDGIMMSNIARFINHSCEGNLMIFRVFSETTDLRYFRIGMFAIQDIEVGDELSYDYNYALSKDSSEVVDDPTAIRCFCGALSCRKWLWRGGDSGLKH